MIWLENLESIERDNKPGTCPICGGGNVEYCFTLVDNETKMGYGDIWCNSCRKGFHLSRVKIKAGMQTGIKVPNNLQY